MPQIVLGIVIGLLVGGVLVAIGMWLLYKPRTEAEYEQFQTQLAEEKAAADREAQSLLNKSKEEAKAVRVEAEKAVQQRYRDLARAEERIDGRQASLDQLAQRLENREQTLNKRQSRMDKRKNRISELEAERIQELQNVANMTTEEARQKLLEAVEIESRQDMARVMREIEDTAKEEAEDKARELISLAVQRVASEHVSDITVSVVPLPNDESKDRRILPAVGRQTDHLRRYPPEPAFRGNSL